MHKPLLLLCLALAVPVYGNAQTTSLNVDGGNAARVIGHDSVPHLVKFSGTLRDQGGSVRVGTVNVSFALYADENGGSALWAETQNVAADEQGKYSVMLGAGSANGLPTDVFSTGEARWLEIKVAGEQRGQRMLLVSVPYALKAADAEKLGGRSASDFVLSANVQQLVKDAVAKQQSAKRSMAPESSATRPTNILGAPISPNPQAPLQSFVDNSTTEVVLVEQDGTGTALHAVSLGGAALNASAPGLGAGAATVNAVSTATSGTGVAVEGDAASTTGIGVYGRNTSTTGAATGVRGDAASSSGKGVQGLATSSTGSTVGVYGATSSATGIGTEGQSTAASGGTGVYGVASGISGASIGVSGEVFSNAGTAVQATSNNAAGKLFVGKGVGGTTKFTVDAAGNVTATGNLNVTGTVNASNINIPGANFANGNTTQVINVQQTGTGSAVTGLNVGTSGSGLTGRALNVNGDAAGITAESASAAGSAAVLSNTGGGRLITGKTNGVETFSVDGTGTINGHALNLFGIGSFVFVDDAFAGPGLNSVAGGFQEDNDAGAGVQGFASSTGASSAGIGVNGVTDAQFGVGTRGVARNMQGFSYGLFGSARSPNGVAGVFDNNAGGQILSLQSRGQEVGSIDGNGNLTVTGSISASNLTIGGDNAISSAPRMFFTGFIPQFSFAGPSTVARTVPDRNIVVTRLTAVVTQPGQLCSPEPQIGLSVNGIGAFSISLVDSANIADSGPIFLQVPANAPLDITVAQPVGGCSGPSPANANVSVQYQMDAANGAAPFIETFTPSSGSAGTQVVITGGGFQNGVNVNQVGVTFNNLPAFRFSVQSDSQITATAPVGVTTGLIRVSTPNGVATSASPFVVNVASAPVITSFSPTSGPAGTVVTVNGSGFLAGTINQSVRTVTAAVGGGPAVLVSSISSDSQLQFELPQFATSGQITITTPAGSSVSSGTFTVTAPPPPTTSGVVSMSPTSGAPGTTVTFSGNNLGGTTAVGFYGFQSNSATFSVVNNNTVTAVVPNDAQSGPVVLTVNGSQISTSSNFIVTRPLNGPFINPNGTQQGFIGQQVTIFGVNLFAQSVSFNGVPAASFSSTSFGDKVTAVVPSGATTGPITIVTANGTAVSPYSFQVLGSSGAPSISSFTPTSGAAGTLVKITGSGFTGADLVLFNAAEGASGSVVSDSEIDVNVPQGFTTGPIVVHTNGFGEAISSTNFTFVPINPSSVTDLGITTSYSVNPLAAGGTTVGTAVITNLGSVTATNVVVNGNDDRAFPDPGQDLNATSFTTTQGTCNSPVNAKSLICTIGSLAPGQSATVQVTFVPKGAATFHILLTVAGDNGEPSFTNNQRSDAVVVTGPAITGFTDPISQSSPTVVITGSGFTGATSVTFAGQPAVSFTVDSDTQISAVAPLLPTQPQSPTNVITVTTPGGTATSDGEFSVVP